MRYLQHENGNLKKNALCKIESQCPADSKHIFVLNFLVLGRFLIQKYA
jgi:hypothetical protein